ncbi:MAG: cupin-like domain-containing protein, partial [Candidatus Binatia bacterium]
ISRMLARREDIFFGAEMRLERRMLKEYERVTAGTSTEREEIPSVRAEDFSVETFKKLYKDKSPLVIRGLGKHTKAAREWSPDFLVGKYGDTRVDIRDSPQERVGAKDNYNEADFIPTPLREYVHEMRHGQSQRYLGAMSELFKHHPELMDDLEIEQLNARIGVKVIRPEIFMGTPRNHTPWHCAGIDNYFLQINGKKHWHFIHPAFTAGLYLKGSAMVFGAPGLFSNVIPGDDRLFPLFAKTPQLEVTLYPGDFLYNPAYFWHEVENIGETIGCALRVVAEGSFNKFVVLDKFLLATSVLNPPMLVSNINMTLNHFVGSRRREKLYINDTGPRRTVPVKGRRGP